MNLPPSVRRLPKAARDLWQSEYDNHIIEFDDGTAKSMAWKATRQFMKQDAVEKSVNLETLITDVEAAFMDQFGELDVWPIRFFDDHVIVALYESFFGPAKFFKVLYSVEKTAIPGDPNNQEIISSVTFAEQASWLRVMPTFVTLQVTKSKSGARRWLSVSSGGFEDRDKQIVSEAFLSYAVAEADKDGYRGSLNIFHMGAGTDVGTCDFQMVTEEGFLVEGGTFFDTWQGQKMADYLETSKAAETGISIEFVYGPNSLLPGGIFVPPGRIIRRSILPRIYAAFPWSGIAMEEFDQMAKTVHKGARDEVKYNFLVDVYGKEKADEILQNLAVDGQTLKDLGIRFREIDVPPTEEKTEESPAETPTAEKTVEPEPEVPATPPQELTVVLDEASIKAIADIVTPAVVAALKDVFPAVEVTPLEAIEPSPALVDLSSVTTVLEKMSADLEALKKADSDKVADMVANLPRAALRATTPVSRPSQRVVSDDDSAPKKSMAEIARESAHK